MNRRMEKNRRLLMKKIHALLKSPLSGEVQSKRYFRTMFMSDIHLGSSYSQGAEFAEFLNETDCETLYLIGDVFDLWCNFRKTWDQNAQAGLEAIMRKVQNGTKVVYIPGNHDPLFRGINRQIAPNFQICDEAVIEHQGKSYWLTHGDIADRLCWERPVLAYRVAQIEHIVRNLGHAANYLTKNFDRSFGQFFHHLIYRTTCFLRKHSEHDFQLINHAKAKSVDGVICGHFHIPEDKVLMGQHYLNCGDWLNHQSVIVENAQGSFELLIIEVRKFVKTEPAILSDILSDWELNSDELPV